jgi:hypothetical protein
MKDQLGGEVPTPASQQQDPLAIAQTMKEDSSMVFASVNQAKV